MVDVLAVGDRYAGDRVGKILGEVLDARYLAEGHRVHRAGYIAHPDRADRDRLDHALVVFADIDDVADRYLILEQDEEAGDDVLDKGLAAKTDRQADDTGAGEQRGDIDADMG